MKISVTMKEPEACYYFLAYRNAVLMWALIHELFRNCKVCSCALLFLVVALLN